MTAYACTLCTWEVGTVACKLSPTKVRDTGNWEKNMQVQLVSNLKRRKRLTYFMCMGALPVNMSVYHMCLQRSEEGIRAPGTGG